MPMTWEEQLQNCITKDLFFSGKKVHLTAYMAELIDKSHSQALKKQFIPSAPAHNVRFSSDYLREDEYMPIPNLIHRYQSKVVILATNQCACYCQFCTRQRITSHGQNSLYNFEEILQYIEDHPKIEDVLISGGDPLVLSTSALVTILKRIEEIDSIKVIRLGTRIPITLPQRINAELIEELKTFNRLYINIHINHPDELTPDSKRAILLLANAGIPLGSQTVLLKDINDDYIILKNLFQQLIQIKIKPYYLYQCDQVQGCENFIVDINKGIDIVNRLCNEISGFAVPKFVIDTPEMGKMVLAPCSITKKDKKFLYLSNNGGSCSYENIVKE